MKKDTYTQIIILLHKHTDKNIDQQSQDRDTNTKKNIEIQGKEKICSD